MVIKLEGGSDHDLRTLDETVASSSNTTMENEEPEDDGTKPTSNTVAAEANGDSEAKKKPESKRTREGSGSDDGAVSDGPDDDEDEAAEKKTNGKKDEPAAAAAPKKKAASQDNEPEAGEVPDAPRALHRTLSIFFRHLPTQTTKDDLENVKKSVRSKVFRSTFLLRSVLQRIRRFSSRLHHGSRARTQIHSTRLGDVRSHRSNSKHLLRTELGESTFARLCDRSTFCILVARRRRRSDHQSRAEESHSNDQRNRPTQNDRSQRSSFDHENHQTTGRTMEHLGFVRPGERREEVNHHRHVVRRFGDFLVDSCHGHFTDEKQETDRFRQSKSLAEEHHRPSGRRGRCRRRRVTGRFGQSQRAKQLRDGQRTEQSQTIDPLLGHRLTARLV